MKRSPPPRLVDDPRFAARTGIDLSTEAELLNDVATPALKQKIVAAALAGALPATAVTTAATAAVMVKAGLLGVVLGAAIGGTTVYVATRPAQAVPVVHITPIAPEVQQGADEVAPAVTAPIPESTTPKARETSVTPKRKKARPAYSPKVRSESNLSDELRAYQRGEVALAEKKFRIAVRAFSSYLKAHPRGSLRSEAELGLLEAHVGANQHRSALKHAKRLLSRKSLSAQRGKLWLVRAASETALKQCEDAERSYRKALAAKAPELTLTDIANARAACDASVSSSARE